MSGSIGSGTNLFGNTAPGTIDPFSLGMLNLDQATADQAMTNRYKQLGLTGNPQGGTPQSAAAAGTNLTQGSDPSTMEGMDLGTLPSLVGGIGAMADATQGQMQNTALNQPSLNTSSLSGLSGLGGKLGGGLGSKL